jgi:hypothetical protein
MCQSALVQTYTLRDPAADQHNGSILRAFAMKNHDIVAVEGSNTLFLPASSPFGGELGIDSEGEDPELFDPILVGLFVDMICTTTLAWNRCRKNDALRH